MTYINSTLINIFSNNFRKLIYSYQDFIGLTIAYTIIIIWLISLIIFFNCDIKQTNILLILASILWQTFFHTGLFINGHDAMHGIAFPRNSKINDLVGYSSLILYALFDYQMLRKRHHLHHQFPASDCDPDYHNGKHKNFFCWYLYFMFRYWSWLRFLGMAIAYHCVKNIFHIHEINLILFWAIPLVLSSLQLFYFGTYLPHREPLNGYDSHRTQSIYRPFWWSLISCYHFGYHKEHHKYPFVPWWLLPIKKDM